MAHRRLTAFFIICALFAFLPDAFAGSDEKALREAFEASVKAEGVKIGDYRLIDQDGKEFRLGEYFRDGKPLVVSFIYTSCPEVCPTITDEFKKAIDGARLKLGDKFNVLTIGFDAENDTPERLKSYGLRFSKDLSAFRLASSDADTVKKLTKQFGFFYVKKKDGSFDHLDMVSVVKSDGSIFKQVYGIRTQSNVLKDRLEELITGREPLVYPKTLIDRIKFFCYKYDPVAGRYVLDYSVIAGFFIQLSIILIIVFAVWGSRIRLFFSRLRKNAT